jgi:histidinol-phosphate aminotransferase
MAAGVAPDGGRPVSPRADIALMSGYHSPQLDVDVRLNTNESAEPPPAAFTQALAEALGTIAWNRYPERAATTLRQRIAELHGVDPGQVFCANGSNEVLQSILLTYGGPGRSVAVWEPTYAMHSHIARVVGSDLLVGERGSDFVLDAEAACDLVRTQRPSVAFVCSPNNPTGVEESMATVTALVETAASTGTLLVADEAYGQFASASALDSVGDDVPLVVTRTYSKTWSLAALRLGYLVGPSWLVDDLEKAALPYRLDAVKQLAGVLALDHVADMEARVRRVVDERQRIVAALASMPVQVWPSGANFVLFRPQGADGGPGDQARGDAVWQGLVERSVLVRNCASWPRLAGCLRVTVGTPSENDRFLTALAEALDA